ncbi:MAG: hypothetical protein CEE38_12200 [Planctomycetes bacterium B3_Pla]|nr:MAG: hypothetical protein CEE38_12200 [Planctomycetes bacterium B3_Pla]
MSNGNEKKFSNRAFVSVLTGFSFVVMALTGLVLFFAPSCRIARDTSWIVWGHNKDQWTGVHVWFSIAFVVASVFHLYLNWAALTNYFKTKLKRGFAFRAEWISALVICGILYAGTVGEVAPFSSLMVWKETFKHGAAGEGQGQGWRGGRAGGPQLDSHTGTVEGNLAIGAQDLHGGNDQQSHSVQAQQQVHSCEEGQTQAHGPGAGRGGMGRQTLRQFCSDGGVELSWALSRLQNEGFTARDTMTMREIADGAGVHPRELRTVLLPEQQ